MLRIRFSRTGKVGQPSFRIVLAEHRAPVKGRYIEILGNYLPARKPKVFSFDRERVTYWISKGAIPTDTVASFLKKQGLEGMDKYLLPRNKQAKKKGEEEKTEKTTQAGSASTEAVAAAPASA